jgi:hypothetical protein
MFKQLNSPIKWIRQSRVCLGLSYLIGFAFLAELIKREPVDISIIYRLGTLSFIFVIMVGNNNQTHDLYNVTGKLELLVARKGSNEDR